jgi:arylsulfatase A-like enzyme
MERRKFLKTVGAGGLSIPIASYFIKSKAEQPAEKPNIIIIYADDMGWGDVGYHGFDDISTPNIDALSTQSVWFSQGYVSASVCSPSRAGLLTGVYQQRFGCGENPPGGGYPDTPESQLSGLPDTQSVLSEMLKSVGYHTGIVGKWHLGLSEEKRPLNRGFDEFYGFLQGAHDYNNTSMEFGDKQNLWPIFRNNQMVDFNGYLTDVFNDEAEDFIRRNKAQPFFLYLSYNAVHSPWQVPASYINRVSHIEGEHRRFFAAMVLAMDDGVGRIVQTLQEEGLEQNTVIMFISDNGSPYGQRRSGEDHMSSPGPFRGWKGDTYEGGIRVPFMIKWPGMLQAGLQYDHPVSTLDIVPTLLSYLGINEPEKGFDFDGIDLMPYLTGSNSEAPHDYLYWRRDDDYAIRHGDWKLAWNDGNPTGNQTAELFNLATDKEEQYDVSSNYPEITSELQRIFNEWDCGLPDSEWWGGPVNRVSCCIFEVPGLIQAEDYCDMFGVAGGSTIGWINNGDWMDYNVEVAETNTYTVDIRTASKNGGGVLQLQVDGNVVGTLNIESTGSWVTYVTKSLTVELEAGKHKLRIYAQIGGFNLDWYDFKLDSGSNSFELFREAEDFNYMSGVQVEPCQDEGGGFNVNQIQTNDWMSYLVDIPATGSYNIEYRVTTVYDGCKIKLDRDAGSIIIDDNIPIPNTGGWHNWTTVTRTITLSAGQYYIGIFARQGGWNFNWFRITSNTAKTKQDNKIDQLNNPPAFKLRQNYPNPFNPVTKIQYDLAEKSFVSLKVYNINGKVAATLVKKEQSTGQYEVLFDASKLTSGIYFCSFKAGAYKSVKRMVLIR